MIVILQVIRHQTRRQNVLIWENATFLKAKRVRPFTPQNSTPVLYPLHWCLVLCTDRFFQAGRVRLPMRNLQQRLLQQNPKSKVNRPVTSTGELNFFLFRITSCKINLLFYFGFFFFIFTLEAKQQHFVMLYNLLCKPTYYIKDFLAIKRGRWRSRNYHKGEIFLYFIGTHSHGPSPPLTT